MGGRERRERKRRASQQPANQPARSHTKRVVALKAPDGRPAPDRATVGCCVLSSSLAVTHRHQPPKKEKNRKKRTTTTIWLASFSLSGSLFSEAPGNLLRWSDGLIIYGPSTRHPGRMASNCSATTHPAGRRGRCLRSGHSSARIKLCDVVLVSALCITISVSILIPSTT